MNTKLSLQALRRAMKTLDDSLREDSTCPKCKKPKDGIIPPDQSKWQAGLCTCQPEMEKENA